MALLCASLLHADDGKWHLVKEGKAKSVIVISGEAAPPERHAAEELQHYLREISGAEVAISSTPTPGLYPVHIGSHHEMIAKEQEKLSSEGFLIHAGPEGLVISAKSPMGVLYGTYAFLEEAAGVRWMNPGKEGEVVPKATGISVNALHRVESPFFTRRLLNLTSVNVNQMLEETWDWMVRNRMQVKVSYKPFWDDPEKADWLARRGVLLSGGGHVLASFVPEEEYYESHPEYFALVNGERKRGGHSNDGHGRVYQRCTSNPEVIRLGVDYVKNFFSGTPPGDMFLIGNNDGAGWCECESCKALDDPEEARNNRVTTRFFRYINAITEEVMKEYPGKEVRAWGYQNFREAPKGVEPHPSLALYVALHGRCYRHSLDAEDCPANSHMREVLKDWDRFKNPLGVREYYSCFLGETAIGPDGENGVIPYIPLEHIVAKDIRYVAGLGYRLWEDETQPPEGIFATRFRTPSNRESWQARTPMYYVAARLLWNPDLDLKEVMTDAYRGWYGPAFEPMKAYRELLVESWENAEGHYIYGANPVFIGRSLNFPGRQEALLSLLDQAALKAEGNEVITRRIALERKYLNDIWVTQAEALQEATAWGDVHARTRTAPIRIDGVLDEGDWAAAPVTSGFRMSGGGLAQQQTFVRVIHDDEAVYFGIEMMEPTPDAMLISAVNRDDKVWGDDSVELFLDPEKSGVNYFHLAINPKGVVYDAACVEGGAMKVDFNGAYEVGTKTLSDRWIVEMRIPYSSLNVGADDRSIWKVNIARARRISESREVSSWSDGRFHQVDSFRNVILNERPTLLRNGGFEESAPVKTDRDRSRHGFSDWKLGNDPELYPLGWRLHNSHPGVFTLITEGVAAGKYAAKIERGWIHAGFDISDAASVKISFQAKGSGKVSIMLYQYLYGKGGAEKTFPTVTLEELELQDEWQKITLEHQFNTPGMNRAALAFAVEGEMLLDDVIIEERQ